MKRTISVIHSLLLLISVTPVAFATGDDSPMDWAALKAALKAGGEIADISDLESDFTWSYAYNNETSLNIYSISFMALTQPEYRFYVKDLTEEQAAAYEG